MLKKQVWGQGVLGRGNALKLQRDISGMDEKLAMRQFLDAIETDFGSWKRAMRQCRNCIE